MDHGVLKENPETTFILLEKAEEGDPDVGREARVLGSYFLSRCAVYVSAASFSFHRYMKMGNRSTNYIIYI